MPFKVSLRGKGLDMFESFAPGRRSWTAVLLGAAALLAVAARLVGIDDNALGISLAMLAAASLVLAIAHPWSSAQFRRLIYASVVGFAALLALGIACGASVALAATPAWVDRLLEVASTAFLLIAAFLCIPGLVVGAIGIAVKRRRERAQKVAA